MATHGGEEEVRARRSGAMKSGVEHGVAEEEIRRWRATRNVGWRRRRSEGARLEKKSECESVRWQIFIFNHLYNDD